MDQLNGGELQGCESPCQELVRLREEIQITREYIHDNNLEWDLLSYSTRKERRTDSDNKTR